MKIVKPIGFPAQPTTIPIAPQAQALAYARRYLRAALSDAATIKPPDAARAGSTLDILQSIYSSRCTGHAQAARQAWDIIKGLRPEYATLDMQSKIISADDLKSLSKPEYMIAAYPFYSGGFNVLVGPSGTGKSFVALDFCGHLIKRGDAVVYVAGEGLHGYAARWEVLKDHLQIQSGGQFHFYMEALQVANPEARAEFAEQLDMWDIKPKFIVIDTMARSSVGIEENSNKEVGVFVAACDALRNMYQCGVLVVHHTGKDGTTRGASALIGACDSAVMLTKVDGRIKMSNQYDDGGKNKFDAEMEPSFWELSPYTVGEFSAPVLRPASAINRNPAISRSLTHCQRSVLEALESIGEQCRVREIVKASSLNQSSVYNSLKELRKASYVICTDDLYEITEEGRKAYVAG